jgi:hypothetical protein
MQTMKLRENNEISGIHATVESHDSSIGIALGYKLDNQGSKV